MATVTLSQRIEAAIIEAVPEITSVVNVTDLRAASAPTSGPRRSKVGGTAGSPNRDAGSEDRELKPSADHSTPEDHPQHGQLRVEAHQCHEGAAGEQRGRYVDHPGLHDVDGDRGYQADDRRGDAQQERSDARVLGDGDEP